MRKSRLKTLLQNAYEIGISHFNDKLARLQSTRQRRRLLSQYRRVKPIYGINI